MRGWEAQVIEDEIVAPGMEGHCSVLQLDRFEAGSRGLRDLLLSSNREFSSSTQWSYGQTNRDRYRPWCPSAALFMPFDGRCRHRRACRDRAHRRYALPCLAVAVPAVVPVVVLPVVVLSILVLPVVVVFCHDRANGIAIAMPVIAVLCYSPNCPPLSCSHLPQRSLRARFATAS